MFFEDSDGELVKFKKIGYREDHPFESWQEFSNIDNKWHRVNYDRVKDLWDKSKIYTKDVMIEKIILIKRKSPRKRVIAHTL